LPRSLFGYARDLLSKGASEKDQRTEPGWYKHGVRGLRYWDGDKWTEHIAPAPAKPSQGITGLQVAVAVFVGVLAAWGAILALAQVDPDSFYVPVKFVVEEMPNR
jgi:hypothetical protein